MDFVHHGRTSPVAINARPVLIAWIEVLVIASQRHKNGLVELI
jgi:hypothetical protein